MDNQAARIVIAALRGGAGKTTVSVALAAALCEEGMAVVPFKKGPDYIDAAWLSLAAGTPCYNLDAFIMGSEQVTRCFSRHTRDGSIAIIEGNRGLFDGMNVEGEFSTAELAKLLHAPVVLVVDCDKVTRTAAAMVLGCCHLDADLDIRGVILSRVSGKRHANVIRQSVEEYCNLPVLGTIPRLPDMPLCERHLGLVPPQEHGSIMTAIDGIRGIARDFLDLDGLIRIARSAPAWTIDVFPHKPAAVESGLDPVRVGVIRDRAFQFYYHDNLEALTDAGADIIFINALDDRELPVIDCLYIGGGFPETQAKALSENVGFRDSVKRATENGLPIYAECGGLMYLGETLTVGDLIYPMVGALPVSFAMERRPQGHGYTVVEVDRQNPFFPVGTRLRGHEFHYSRLIGRPGEGCETVYNIIRGTGMGGGRDGIIHKNILAGFIHLHALGAPKWASGMLAAGRRWKAEQSFHSCQHETLMQIVIPNVCEVLLGDSEY
ncbi:MAG: Cobyrinate a,c-diamide synthase [Syntrophus sp. SKADARSKE-3]|nr:Cobyrinate a,c-diamide synthase [Syntrophus sp. SKADARSKE-3]